MIKYKINIRKFLIRRSLRIWPLFYLMVIIAFLLPNEIKNIIGFHMLGGGYDFDWRYSFTFLENYNMLYVDNFPKTTPLSVFWSLCIEEHFYIFWIICLSLLPIKHFTKLLFVCITLTGSIIISMLSYHYFEYPFLQLRDKLTKKVVLH